MTLPTVFNRILLMFIAATLAHAGDDIKKRAVPMDFPKMSDIRPDIKKKAEALVLQLSATSYKDRKNAGRELEALGPVVIPLLESHANSSEPETREAIPDIVRSLYGQLHVTIEDLKLTLVPIGPGSFMMGDLEAEKIGGANDIRHNVMITSSFWMGQTEVTQRQYKAIMGKNPSDFKNENSPVETVSWNDATDFCKRLTARERKARRLLATQVYRLPTEAEWEYCCRAGSKTIFSCGDDVLKLGSYAWSEENSGKKPHIVAQKKPNAWGLYDMHGNIWEWCGDWSGEYPNIEQTDPTGPQSGLYRILRGGTWAGNPKFCASALRFRGLPSIRDICYGFRIVRGHPLPTRKKVPNELQKKMSKMIVKKISLVDTPLPKVLEFLKKQSKALNPKGKGVDFILINKSNKPMPTMTMDFDNIPLSTAVRYICEQANTAYQFDAKSGSVIITIK